MSFLGEPSGVASRKVGRSLKLLVTLHLHIPLSPNSDQHQFSPNNISTQLREKVVRINKMITWGKML